MSEKPSVAFTWCAGCGGCEESFVDLAEDLPGAVAPFEIAYFPMLVDAKLSDIEARADASITASFISGSIVTEEHVEMARLLRQKSLAVVAFGACAHLGGVPGLANRCGLRHVLQVAAEGAPIEAVSGDSVRMPGLPSLGERVRRLDEVIEVDYYLPGCPPTSAMTGQTLRMLQTGSDPPADRVLAPDIALCEECPRKDTRSGKPPQTGIERPHWVKADPDQCLLNQGLLCFGAGTRGGCGAACIAGNMPCTGCFGPVSRVRDHGAKLLSIVAGVLSAEDEDGVRRESAGIPDPLGTLYRYGLPASLLRIGRG